MRLQLLLAALCATYANSLTIDEELLEVEKLFNDEPQIGILDTIGEDISPHSRPGENGGGVPPAYLIEPDVQELPGPRPGENGGGLPPSRPGENGGGLPPLIQSRPGENGGGLPPILSLRPGENGGGLQPLRPGENGGGLPPSRPGENGGGLPPISPSRPGENGGGLPPIHLRPGNARCVLPRDPGPCIALIPRYYYDARTNCCKRFNYGGCLGNANNFNSVADCQRSCVVPRESSHHHGEKPCWKNKRRCEGPAVAGPCMAAMPRFYYDADSNSCRSFIYGGCGRNDNHWLHRQNCESVCVRKTKPSKCRNGSGKIFYLPPRRRHCPVLPCSRHCKHGYKRDEHGCATCHCLKHCKHRHSTKHHNDRNDGRHLSLDLDF